MSWTDPPWLERLRDEARQLLEGAGLPTRKLEDWRFTDVRPVAERDFAPAGPAVPEVRAPGAGVRVLELGEALEREPGRVERLLGRAVDPKTDGFTALATARLDSGVWIEIEPGRELTEPIEIAFPAPPAGCASHPRVLIDAGERSRARVVERWTSEGSDEDEPTLRTPVSEIALGPDARLEHVRWVEEGAHAFHIASVAARCERSSRFAQHAYGLGGRIARTDLRVQLAGEGAEVDLFGLYLGRGRELVDHHTTIDHAVPRTASRELYKGILDERARAVFRGRVHVAPHAQQIDARQTNRNLLLSDGAQVNTKPELEIHADDVKCAHGASIGRLDAEALYYLRSRGIPAERARALLTWAFAAELLDALPEGSEDLRARVRARLPGAPA